MCYIAEFDLTYSLVLIFAYRCGDSGMGESLFFVLSSHLKLKVREKNGWYEELAFQPKCAYLILEWKALFIYGEWCWHAKTRH